MNNSHRNIIAISIILLIIIIIICTSCDARESKTMWQYGIKESFTPGDALRFKHNSLDDMYTAKSTDTVMIVYTRTPLEQRQKKTEPNGGGLYTHYTFTNCIVLDVIKNSTNRELAPGDQITLAERIYIGESKGENGGMEPVLYRDEPYFYPIDIGQPYLVFSTSNQAFGEAYVYWPCIYGLLDVSSLEPTGSEKAAMTPDSDSLDAAKYTGVLNVFAEWKAAAVKFSYVAPFFDKYAGMAFE